MTDTLNAILYRSRDSVVAAAKFGGRTLLIGILALCVVPLSRAYQDFSYEINEKEVVDLFFLDSLHGWISALDHSDGQAYVFRTDNGGETWTRWNAPERLLRLYFISPKLGWALTLAPEKGSSETTTYLLRTKDGGKTWKRTSVQPIARGPDMPLFLAFLDSRHGWFVGSGSENDLGLVLETSNGGKSVRRLDEVSKSIKSCYGIFASQKVGVWVYGYGAVLHLGNESNAWESPLDLKKLRTNPGALSVASAFIWASGRGWLAAQVPEGNILETEDSGQTWRPVLELQFVKLEQIASWDKNHACVQADHTLLLCTTDGGITWNRREVLPPPNGKQAGIFVRLVMLKSGRGWILRAGGFLYQTTNGGETWKELDLLKPVAASHALNSPTLLHEFLHDAN